jgi:hypothetical protein
VGYGGEDVLADLLREEFGPLLLAGRAEEPRAAGEAEEDLRTALGTPDPGEAAAGNTAVEEGGHGVLHHPSEGAVFRLEALLVDTGELRRVLVKKLVERGALRVPGAVESRPLGDEEPPVRPRGVSVDQHHGHRQVARR